MAGVLLGAVLLSRIVHAAAELVAKLRFEAGNAASFQPLSDSRSEYATGDEGFQAMEAMDFKYLPSTTMLCAACSFTRSSART